MSLFATLAETAARQPEAPCLPGLNWGAMWTALAAEAAALASCRGRVVVVARPEGPGQALGILSAIHAGAMALPLAASTPARERERLLAGLDVAVVLTDDSTATQAPGPAAAPHGASNGQAMAQAAPGQRTDVATQGVHAEIALLLATSGSTGEPKRVAHTLEALTWNARAHADAVGLPAGVRTLVTSPLAHAFPLVAQLLATLLRGGSLAWPAGAFTPRAFARQVAAEGIGYAALPPALARLVMARIPEAAGLPPILSVGAAPIVPDELVALVEWARRGNSRLHYTYGLSEAGPRVSTLSPDDVPGREATVGRLLPGVEARIVADEPGQPGEVWLRSPSLMWGYYPERSGLAPDGWLPTGDLGCLEDGYLRILGRLKDVIVCGGVSIWARELEDALRQDPAVADVAVVGRRDPAYGEVPVAFVVGNGPVVPEALLAALTERLSRPKLPHQVLGLAALPRTPLGKVDKARLREAACEALR